MKKNHYTNTIKEFALANISTTLYLFVEILNYWKHLRSSGRLSENMSFVRDYLEKDSRFYGNVYHPANVTINGSLFVVTFKVLHQRFFYSFQSAKKRLDRIKMF